MPAPGPFPISRSARDPVIRLFTLTTLLLVITMGFAGFYALGVSQRYLLPALDRKAHAVGEVVAHRTAMAVGYGIPFERLVGMDDYLASIISAQPEIAYLGITDQRGHRLYRAGLGEPATGTTAKPVAVKDGLLMWLSGASLDFVGRPPLHAKLQSSYYDTAIPLRDSDRRDSDRLDGILHVGVSAGFYRSQIAEQMEDIGVVLLAALLIAFEVLLAVVTMRVTSPLATLKSSMRAVADGLLVRPPASTSTREIAHLADRVSALVDDLRAAFERLTARLEHVRAGRPERDVQTALTRVAEAVRAVIRPPADGDVQPNVDAAFTAARVCAFLFVSAEEMARPFLPVYIRGVAERTGLGSDDLVVGLPMSLFMLVAAVSMASLVGWSERLGRRRSFVIGALLSSVGLLGTAFAFSYWDLLAWRALSACGYATAFVACQGQVLDVAGPTRRARGVAVFVGGITAADICGPAIGGILAGEAGFSSTLAAGAVLALLAGVAGLRALSGVPGGGVPPAVAKGFRFADSVALLRNRRFSMLLVLAAMPAKLLLTGVLFFLVPLIASEFGASQAAIGRLVMMYGIASFVLSSPFARLADRWNLHGVMVGAGGMLAGVGMLPMLFEPGLPKVAIAVVALGVGQAMSISPQLALALRVCEPQVIRFGHAPVLGLYRLVERLGGALGPFVAGGLVGLFGYANTMAVLGAGAAMAAVLFSIAFLLIGVVDHPDDRVDDADPLDMVDAPLLAGTAKTAA